MRKWIALGIVATVALVGCGDPEAKLIGSWRVGAEGSASIDLKAEHKFSLGGLMPMTGTWKLSGDKVLLKVEQVASMPVQTVIDQLKTEKTGKFQGRIDALQQPIEAKLSEDRTTMTISLDGGVPMSFVKR